MNTTSILVFWKDLNGTRDYEWIDTVNSNLVSLDFTNKNDKQDLKVYVANTEKAKEELDMKLMLWLGI